MTNDQAVSALPRKRLFNEENALFICLDIFNLHSSTESPCLASPVHVCEYCAQGDKIGYPKVSGKNDALNITQ